MAKRMVDGEAIWTSEKLLNVPPELRAEYVWVLPLAEANGCCEYNPTLIWRNCYAVARPGWTPKKVEELFDALEAAKMVFRFTARYTSMEKERNWCFFIGMEKRLPKPSERGKYKIKASIVPLDGLATFLGESVETVSLLYREVLATTSRLSAGADADAGVGSGADTEADVGVGSCSATDAGVDAAIDAAAASLPSASVATASAEKTSKHFPLNHHSITAIENQQQASKNQQQETFTSSGSRSKEEIEIPVEAIEESRPDLAWATLTAEIWHKLMGVNPNSDPAKIPSQWGTLWAKDFMDLSARYTRLEISDMIALSQSPSQEKFYVRPSVLVDKAKKLTKDIDYIKRQKNGAGWRIVVDCLKKKMAKVNEHPVPVEEVAFLDEPSFNIEGDEDELA